MKSILVLPLMLVAASPASAATICPLRAPQGEVVVMRSSDAVDTCRAEMEAIGKAGPICGRGIAAVVSNGTKAQWTGFAGVAGELTKVRILEGAHAGTTGVVRSDRCKP